MTPDALGATCDGTVTEREAWGSVIGEESGVLRKMRGHSVRVWPTSRRILAIYR